MRLPLAAAAVAWYSLLPAAAFAQPAASLSTWQTSNGTGVRFVQLTPDVVDLPMLELPYETSDGAYKYAVDTSTLSWRPDCTCYRYYVIFARARATGVLTRHKFKGIPSGSFVDQQAPVRLSITDPAGAHTDDIAVPVASAPGLEALPLLELKTDKPLVPLSLGGITEVQLTIRNTSPHDSVEIASDVAVTPQARNLWKTPPTIVGTTLPLTLGPQTVQTITLRLEPLVKQALALSFPPTAPELQHTVLRLDLPYSSHLFVGREGHLVMDIPLRFKPGVLALVLWLLGGVVIGSMVPLLSGWKASALKKWPRVVATALMVGLVLELFGIVLVQNRSKLVLFGFEIDPWQTTPVMVLGIVTGLMGLQAARLIQDRLKKEREAPAPIA